MTTISERPWEKIAIDIFDFDNKQYLITVDYFSGFFEINQLSNLKSVTIINILKTHFGRYGLPQILVSDNGA